VQALVRDLNRVYRQHPALHAGDVDVHGFAWVIGDDIDNSVFAFLRRHEDDCVLVVCNMTPVPRHGYCVGVPLPGVWNEILNSDARAYGGSGMGNCGAVQAREQASHGHPCSLSLVLPPLATIMLTPASGKQGDAQ